MANTTRTPNVFDLDSAPPIVSSGAVFDAPPAIPTSPVWASNAPELPAQAAPAVKAAPSPFEENLNQNYTALNKLREQKANPWGTENNHPGTLGKIGHIFSTIGNIAGDVVAPGVMARIPGTQLNRDMMTGQLQDRIEQEEQEKGQLKSQELKPQLDQAKLALSQEKQSQTHEHQQTQDEQQLRKAGLTRDASGAIVPVPYEQLAPHEQATTDLQNARSEAQQAQEDYRKAQTANMPEQMEIAKGRLANAQKNANTAIARLGLSQQEFGFNQDKFYNPQPTANERKSGDLAESAVNQVHTMRSIIAAHPEMFGPGGAAKQQLTRWLSSGAEDAGKFNAAKDYLAEHSAGVFGGRGAYIIKELQNITNPNQDPSALRGALDQAEQTATHFVNKGAVHGKGGGQSEGGGGQSAPKVGDVVDGYRFKGGAPHDKNSWEQVKK